MSDEIVEFDRHAEVNVLAAEDHRFGPGQIHVWVDEDAKTLCGHPMSDYPGQIEFSQRLGHVTCKSCLRCWRAARRREQMLRDEEARVGEWQRRVEEAQARRVQDDREWWARYDAYLASPEWAHRRELVLKRAGGTCEGCLERPATIAHHLTYVHVGDEFMFELRAVCAVCHKRLHPQGGGPRW